MPQPPKMAPTNFDFAKRMGAAVNVLKKAKRMTAKTGILKKKKQTGGMTPPAAGGDVGGR